MSRDMKTKQLLALALVVGFVSVAEAGGSCNPPPSNPGGGSNEPPPDCVVTWDFTQNNAVQQTGDPLTYSGTSNGGGTYGLQISGFTVDRRTNNGGDIGKIRDASEIYATDYDGADGSYKYAIGVHAQGEDTHWGTKIDNNHYSGEDRWVRDGVLLDFMNCTVSLDEIGLLKAFSTADTDFELWAYTGSLDTLSFNPTDLNTLPDFDTWGSSGNDWSLVEKNQGGTVNRTVQISNATTSRFFALVAGTQILEWDDAFRLASLTVTCDPNCEPGTPQPPSSGGVPIPGTLALLGIGALATRRRFLKQS